jgi:hypothetical protein
LTKDNGKKSRTAVPRESSWFDWLIFSMFKEALPVWERYDGRVPAVELRKLERAGDWPRGVAAALVKRLSGDEELRAQVHKLVLAYRARREKVDESTA